MGQVETAAEFDVSSVLGVYVVLLLAIPSSMVVAPLGAAGAPSAIMAIGIFLLWCWLHVQREAPTSWGSQPVRRAALIWLLIMVVVYAHAMASPIPSDEVSVADSGLLKLLGLVGVVLLANDGVLSLRRQRVVVDWLVIAVGLVALLGLLQYVTKQLFVDRLVIPGLTSGSTELVLAQRSGFSRPSGTSTHPIEYGVILTMVLPLAVTYAMRATARRWLYRGVAIVIAFAVFLSISRSAIVCAAVGFVFAAVSWTAAARLRALAVLLGLAVTVYLTVPGVLGAVSGLFVGALDDPSITSRTGSYDVAAEFISKSPWLGRGFGTFLPKYWILDNGYLGLLIEGGVLGLAGFLFLIAAAMMAARATRRSSDDDFDRAMAQALLAAVAAGACSLAFFDTFAFPQSAGCFFLILGLAGAQRRLTRTPERPEPSGVPVEVLGRGGRR